MAKNPASVWQRATAVPREVIQTEHKPMGRLFPSLFILSKFQEISSAFVWASLSAAVVAVGFGNNIITTDFLWQIKEIDNEILA
jgi:hypothetical protein